MIPISGKGMYLFLAELVGQDNVNKIYGTFRGQRLYIIDLAKTQEATSLRNEQIREHYRKGTDIKTLAKMYRMSTRWVREIVKGVSKEK